MTYNLSDEELKRELENRGYTVTKETIRCKCGKWPLVYKHYQGHGMHWHCVGCNKRQENCTC